jgi:broad specificity phosphatase PhoE
MLDLILIRHASTAVNEAHRYQGRIDPPLSPLGRAQAVRLRGRLRGLRFDAVARSDARRCAETLELILPGRIGDADLRLRELDFGLWDGRTYAECALLDGPLLTSWIADPSAATPPGGETFADFCRRVDGWLDDLPRSGRALVVAHAGSIRRIVARALGLEWRQVAAMKLDASGITRLDLHIGGASLTCLNDTAHLRATHPNQEPKR